MSLDIETLVTLAELVARRRFDGHFTLYRFTTHWRIAARTLGNLDVEYPDFRHLPTFVTMADALQAFILDPDSFVVEGS